MLLVNTDANYMVFLHKDSLNATGISNRKNGIETVIKNNVLVSYDSLLVYSLL